jgi:hypothetical protein
MATCQNGHELPGASAFCPTCGAPAAASGGGWAPQPGSAPPGSAPPAQGGYPPPPQSGYSPPQPGYPPPGQPGYPPTGQSGYPPPGPPGYPPGAAYGGGFQPAPPPKRHTVRRILIGVGVLILIFLGIGIYEVSTPGHQFTSSQRSTFLKGCEQSGGNSAFCGCALSYLEKHVSEVEFNQIAKDPSSHQAEVTAAAQACVHFLQGSSST